MTLLDNTEIEISPESKEEFCIFDDKLLKENGIGITKPSLSAPDWVCAVVASPDLKFYLVKQFRNGIKKDMVEFPQGKVKNGETALTAILRELKEEIGLDADHILQIQKITEGNPCAAYFDNKVTLFKVITTMDFTPPEVGESDKNEASLEVITLNGGEVANEFAKSEQTIYMKYLWDLTVPEFEAADRRMRQAQMPQQMMPPQQ